MEEDYQNAKQLMKVIKAFYVERTNLTKSFLKKALKKDIQWDAETCLEHGLVDKILQ
jgi:ATP-dependent protease ClpP protease subunit